MKGALSAGIVRNGKESRKHPENFGVEFGALRHFGLAMDGKDVPPHITSGVEWVG
jgi:hypothetical protein